MVNFKQEIAKEIAEVTNLDSKELENYIEIPPNSDLGDYAFPCFKLAKELRKAPPMIANDIKENIKIDEKIIEKIEVVGGYLNIYVNKQTLAKEVLEDVAKNKEKYGSSDIGKGKNVVIDYSAPNIAKPFHIGHLRSTVIGGALYKIYNFLGYNSVGINFLGDWGLQFGKVMAGIKLWKDEYDFKNDEMSSILKTYIRFNKEEKEKPELTDLARAEFKKLEDGDQETYKLWEHIRKISLENYEKTYKLLNSKFDSYNGEAYYNDKMEPVVEELKEKGLLKESQGAQVVDLEKYNMPPCIIITSAGTTIYATRDLASLEDRMNTYNFDKAIYVVGNEQALHFKQVFKVFELMGYENYAKNCVHVPFGLVVDKDGEKIGSRKGNSVFLEDILNEAIDKVKDIINEKNLPETDGLIREYSKRRNPFNHPCTCFRKHQVYMAGGYLDCPGFEDYYLWLRMLSNGCTGYNIQKPVLYMRSGREMYLRRGGLKYTADALRFRKLMYSGKFCTLSDFLICCCGHIIIGLIPNKLRMTFYSGLLRKKNIKGDEK